MEKDRPTKSAGQLDEAKELAEEVLSSDSSDQDDANESSDCEVLHNIFQKVNLSLAQNVNQNTDDIFKKIAQSGGAGGSSSSSAVASGNQTNFEINLNLDADKTAASKDSAIDEVGLDAADQCTAPDTKKPCNKKSILLDLNLRRNDNISKVFDGLDILSKARSDKVEESRAINVPKESTKSNSRSAIKSSVLQLDSENLLILRLLSMHPKERNNYILKLAETRKLLIKDVSTNRLSVNPQLVGLKSCNVPNVEEFVSKFQRNFEQNVASEKPNYKTVSLSYSSEDEPQFNKMYIQKGNPNFTKRQRKDLNKHFREVNRKQEQSSSTSLRRSSANERYQTFDEIDSMSMVSQQSSGSGKRKRGRNRRSSRTAVETPPQNFQVEENTKISDMKEKIAKIKAKIDKKLLCNRLEVKTKTNDIAINCTKPPATVSSCTDALENLYLKSVEDRKNKVKENIEKMSKKIVDSKKALQEVSLNTIKNEPIESAAPQKQRTISESSLEQNLSRNIVQNQKHANRAAGNPQQSTTDFNDLEAMQNSDDEVDDDDESSSQSEDVSADEKLDVDLAESFNFSIVKDDEVATTSAENGPDLNSEVLLIMKLLTLSLAEQERFLYELAEKKNILKKVKKDKKFFFHPHLANVSQTLLHPDVQQFIKINSSAAVSQQPNTYEYQVNNITSHYLGVKTINFSKHFLILGFKNEKLVSQMGRLGEIEKFVSELVEGGFGKVIESDIRINEYDYNQSFVRNTGERDVYIPSILLRRCAMHGDIVRVFVFNESQKKVGFDEDIEIARNSRGFVLNIVERRHPRKVVGEIVDDRMKNNGRNYYTITPRDKRIPRVRINKLKSEHFKTNYDMLYFISITEWQRETPLGQFIEEIGKTNSIHAGNKAILLQNSLEPMNWSDELLKSIPTDETFTIPPVEYECRENLTADCIFTIDPKTARDLDDALSCRQLINDNYEIGVHISDVTYFIAEGSELDNLISQQTTTIYLVDSVYHMLPRALCELCSLLPGKDKLTFSVFWEITKTGEIVSTRFAKTIINSCVQLAYEHAQLMIEDPSKTFSAEEIPVIHNNFTATDLSKIVNRLNSIALILRKQRFDNGAISLNQPKIKFSLNENLEPVSIHPEERHESNNLIEEFMLLANQSVAKHCFERFPNNSILRNHGVPKDNLMDELKAKLNKLNYYLDCSSSTTIAASINDIIKSSSNNEAVSCALNSMLAKPMVRAEYICSDIVKNSNDVLWHFALSIPIYTHFTSPIRRYADVMVHRVLSAALSLSPEPKRSVEDLWQVVTMCNTKKYDAKLAGEDSTNLYFMHYLTAQKKHKMRAVIRDIDVTNRTPRLEVMLIDSGHKIKITMKDLSADAKVSVVESDPWVATLQFKNDEHKDVKILLKVFAEIIVEVSVKKDKLKARIVPN